MPAVISSPSPPPPMKAASVAADTICTAAVRTPAKITGRPSGDPDVAHDLAIGHALSLPASTTSGSTLAQRGMGVDEDRRQTVESERDDGRQEAGADQRQGGGQQGEAGDGAQHVDRCDHRARRTVPAHKHDRQRQGQRQGRDQGRDREGEMAADRGSKACGWSATQARMSPSIRGAPSASEALRGSGAQAPLDPLQRFVCGDRQQGGEHGAGAIFSPKSWAMPWKMMSPSPPALI